MNGVHDLGGMHGFGPIDPARNGGGFESDWERRMFGVMIAILGAGHFGVDEFRHGVERMNPAEYLASPYYEHWLVTLETLLQEHGVITAEELAGKARPDPDAPPVKPAVSKDNLLALLNAGASLRLPRPVAPRFRPGDHVQVRNINPEHHTRLPRYARGKRGILERDHGVFTFPDTLAHGRGEKPQHVYSVRFTARELWGPQAPERDTLHLDMWDDYLDLAL